MTSLVLINRDSIIQQVEAGIKLAVIAKQYGITRQAISIQLAHDLEYQEARIAGLANRLDDREGELEASTDLLTLARSKELLSHARWRCEREAPQYWGNKGSSININPADDGKISITINEF